MMANRLGRDWENPTNVQDINSPLSRVGPNPRKPSRPAVKTTASTGRTQDRTRPNAIKPKKSLQIGSHPHRTFLNGFRLLQLTPTGHLGGEFDRLVRALSGRAGSLLLPAKLAFLPFLNYHDGARQTCSMVSLSPLRRFYK